MKGSYEKFIALDDLMFPGVSHLDRNTANAILAKLLEEAGELSGHTSAYFGRPYRPELVGDIIEIKKEIGDCFVVLFAFCRMFQVCPEECVDVTFDKLKKRYETNRR